jgi:glycosyltransferase involved in cell wall biosynthesis
LTEGGDFDPRIVFYDPLCPAPYSRTTLEQRGLGGSEACVIRVAEALNARVMQHCRVSVEGRYCPPSTAPEAEHVIVMRDARALRALRPRFPNARFYVWLHDLAAPGSTRARWLTQSEESLGGVTLICVSAFLQRRVATVVSRLERARDIEIRTLFNPIDDDLGPSDAEVDAAKLLFLSSPNKGLSYVLTAFQAIRRALPRLRLHVANPGYRQLPALQLPDVVWLGALPPAQAMAHARSALCVFMPGFRIPETFGLVFAEANAVGTPVLAHDCGAAREVLHQANPVLPIRARQRGCARLAHLFAAQAPRLLAGPALHLGVFDDYIDLLRLWQSGQRPRVAADARFRLSAVADEWRRLLR